MKTQLLLPLAVLIIAGCAPKDREALVRSTRTAMNSAGAALHGAWVSANDQARNLGADSDRKDLEKAKQRLSKETAQAAKAGDKQLDAVKAQISRLDAAEKLQDAERVLKEKLAEVQKEKDALVQDATHAQKGVNDVENSVNGLKTNLDKAKTDYDEACKRASDAWRAITGA